MNETERYAPFRVEFLIYLTPVLLVLALVIFKSTGEFLFVNLMFFIVAAFILGWSWFIHKEYEPRLGKRGALGCLLLFFSYLMDEWIWVQLCLALLGSGLMLYDIASKREISDTERGEG